jgi:nitronate monooxygenase
MALPVPLQGRLAVPVIVAPMEAPTGPDFVIESCRSGMLGTFAALDHRTSGGFEESLSHVQLELTPDDAPFGVSLVAHATNPRFADDLAICIEHRVPVILAAQGILSDVVARVHDYGGVVFQEITAVRHAKAAAHAGVDGVVSISAGAGGHAETVNPFVLLAEIRRFFGGTVVLAGCVSDGRGIAAARMLGADLAHIDPRSVAAGERPGAFPLRAHELCRRLAREYAHAIAAFDAGVTDLARPVTAA